MERSTPARRSSCPHPNELGRARTRMPLWREGLKRLVRRDVLVHPEEVVRVVLPLQSLQAVVPFRSVRLPDPLLAFVHQEVDVDARVVGLQGGPQTPGPLTLFVEARLRCGGRVDVDRVPRAATVERSLVLAHPLDRAAELE